MRGRRIPQPGTVDVVIAAHVHELGRSIGQHHGPDTTLLRMHAERSLITETKAGRVTLCDASARPTHIVTETTVVHEGVQIAGRGSNIVLGTVFLLASPGGMAIRGTPRCCPPSPTCLRRRNSLCRVVDTLVASGHHVTRGLQGEGCRRKVGETDARDPGHELVQVAPNMGAGGSHPQATSDQECAQELHEIWRMVEFLVR